MLFKIWVGLASYSFKRSQLMCQKILWILRLQQIDYMGKFGMNHSWGGKTAKGIRRV